MESVARALVHGVDVAVCVSAPDGSLVAASAPWCALVGDRSEPADRWLELLDPEDRERLRRELEVDGAAGRETRAQVRLPDGQGETRWWSVARVPVCVEGSVVWWMTQLLPAPDRALAGDVAWHEGEVLRAAESIVGMGAWDWHIDSGALWWSDEVYRIFGLRPQEFPATYEGFLAHVHPDDRDEVERHVAAAVAGEREYDLRHRVVRPDGTVRYVREQGRVNRDDTGAPVRMLGTVLDVTDEALAERERARALRDLAESEQRYRLLVENSSDFVGVSDEHMRIEWMSDSVTRVLGWAPEDLVGRSAKELVHPDDLALVRAHADQFDSGAPFEARYRLRCKDGSYRWISRITRGVADGSGRIVRHIGGFRDVQSQVEAEEAVETERARLVAAMDAMLDPHVLLEAVRDGDGRIVDFLHVDANRAADAHTRALADTLVGKRLLDLTPGQAAAGMVDLYARVVETGVPLILDAFPYADEAAGGRVRLFDMRGVKVGDGLSLTFRDVTERVSGEQALAESEARYRLLAEHATDVICQIGPDGSLEWVSDSVTALLGWDPSDLAGRSVDLVHPADLDRVQVGQPERSGGARATAQARVATAAGGWRWMAITVSPVVTDAGPAQIVALRDVQDEVAARVELEHALGHDALTGLVGRDAVVARVRDQLAAHSASEGRALAVMAVAIDSLGDVVSGLGHAAGDLLITTVVTRLVVSVGDPERMGRGSGNEFFVFVPGLDPVTEAATLAASMHRGVRGPVLVHGQVIEPTVSVGLATGTASDDADQLLRDATSAMRRAKSSGRDQTVFADPVLADTARERLAVESRIREGLRLSQFLPWFQPIVELGSGKVAGYEALARWVQQDGTVQRPADFMAVAESSGLVSDLDLAMLDGAISVLAQMSPPLTVSVNASAATLARPMFAERVLGSLEEHGADPSRLHLEVTETTLLTVTDTVLDSIRRLADAGIRWYVDDFGTGYSSISHLRDLPIAGLKLDGSFTAQAPTGHRSRQLAAGLAALSARLDLDTVAEGVETRQQANILLDQGWQHAQGWLYGRPQPWPPD